MTSPTAKLLHNGAYARHDILGQGTYATVYLATNVHSGEKVAIKKIKISAQTSENGIDVSAIREIKSLAKNKQIHHHNIIKLYDVFMHKGNIHLVLEFLTSDLEMIIKDRNIMFSQADIKSWMLMTCRGVEHCHRNWIIHRDLKPNNLLLAKDGQLKIADFGMARVYGESFGNMTSQVVTRWYRAPELLFGAKDYGDKIDSWSIGCIFAELMLRVPFLAAESDLGQLEVMFRALGTPTDWPEMIHLPAYVTINSSPRIPLKSLFTAASQDALDLLEKLLVYNPLYRLSTRGALEHSYFTNKPIMTHHEKLPKITGTGGVVKETG